MKRHVYGIDPATGRAGQYVIDCGPAKVRLLRGASVVPQSAKNSGNYGRKLPGGRAA